MTLINQLTLNPSKKDIRIIDYCIVRAANHRSGGQQNIWSVVTDSRNRILGEGGNVFYKSHPLQHHYNMCCARPYIDSLHAEIHAIVNMKKGLKKGTKLFVARSSIYSRSLLVRPCEVCTYAISTEGIKKVYWTINEK